MNSIIINHYQADKLHSNQHTTIGIFPAMDIHVGESVQVVSAADKMDQSSWKVIGTAIIEKVVEDGIENITLFDAFDPFIHDTATFKEYLLKQNIHTMVTLYSAQITAVLFKPYDNPIQYEVTKTTEKTELKLFTDGGSRGNPGPSALGYVLFDMDDNVVTKGSKYIGITTNNQAEYQAVKTGLLECQKLGAQKVHVFMDSQLVARQMNGEYKIKNRDLWPIHQAITSLKASFKGGVSFTYVPREYNKDADLMVNKELDNHDTPYRQ